MRSRRLIVLRITTVPFSIAWVEWILKCSWCLFYQQAVASLQQRKRAIPPPGSPRSQCQRVVEDAERVAGGARKPFHPPGRRPEVLRSHPGTAGRVGRRPQPTRSRTPRRRRRTRPGRLQRVQGARRRRALLPWPADVPATLEWWESSWKSRHVQDIQVRRPWSRDAKMLIYKATCGERVADGRIQRITVN